MGQSNSVGKLKNILMFLVIDTGESTDVGIGDLRTALLDDFSTGANGMDLVISQCGNIEISVIRQVIKGMFVPYGNGYNYAPGFFKNVKSVLPTVTVEV